MHRSTFPTFFTAIALFVAIASAATVLTSVGFGMDPLEPGPFASPEDLNVTVINYDPKHAHTGNGYLSVYFPAAPRQQVAFGAPPIVIGTNKTYTSSIWAKSAANNGNCAAAVGVQDLSDGGEVIDLVTEFLTKSYKKVYITISSNGYGHDKWYFYFYVSCLGGVEEQLYLDDYKLVVL